MGTEEMFCFSRNFLHMTYTPGHNFSALGQKQNLIFFFTLRPTVYVSMSF